MTITAPHRHCPDHVPASPEWLRLKAAATALQALQAQDGSVPDAGDHAAAAGHVATITGSDRGTRPALPARRRLPGRCWSRTSARWADGGFGVPDFLDSLLAFQPQQHRVDGLRHLVVFPMYTQNGSTRPPGRGGAGRGHLARVHRRAGGRRLLQQALRADPLPRLHRPATTRTPPCSSRRPSRCARSRRSPGARSSPTARPPASAASCARPPRSPRCELPADAAGLLEDQAADRGDLRHVGPHPRPHPHARRPALRPVHDQAADAVLPVLAGGTALRPHRVPRVRRASSATRTRTPRRAGTPSWCSTPSSSTASSASPSPAAACATTTASAASCCSPGCTSTTCCTGPTPSSPSTGTRCRTSWSRSARGSRTCTGARSTGPRPRTGSPPTSWSPAPLTPQPGLGLGQGPGRPAAGRAAAGPHRPGARRRVPAVHVLRGAGEEDAPGHRIHRRHHGVNRPDQTAPDRPARRP